MNESSLTLISDDSSSEKLAKLRATWGGFLDKLVSNYADQGCGSKYVKFIFWKMEGLVVKTNTSVISTCSQDFTGEDKPACVGGQGVKLRFTFPSPSRFHRYISLLMYLLPLNDLNNWCCWFSLKHCAFILFWSDTMSTWTQIFIIFLLRGWVTLARHDRQLEFFFIVVILFYCPFTSELYMGYQWIS